MEKGSGHHSLQTFADFIALLKPGEQILVSLPGIEFAANFLPLFLQTERGSGKTLFLASDPGTEWPDESAPPRIVFPEGMKSAREALAFLRPLLETHPKHTPALIECAANQVRWLPTRTARREFFLGAQLLLRRQSRRGLWLFDTSYFLPEDWPIVHEQVEYVLNVALNGPLTYAHFLKAPSSRGPDFYLPRHVSLAGGQLLWGKPIRPAEETLEPSRKILRLEEKLQESAAEQRFHFNASPYPRAIFSPRKFLDTNEAFARVFSWADPTSITPHAFFGKQNADFLKELFYEEEPGRDAESRNLRRDVHFKAADGSPLDFELSVIVVREPDRKIYHASFVDVTERKALLKQLQESESYWRSLLESSAGAVALVQDGALAYVNRGCMELFGYMIREELIGKPIIEIVQSKDRKLVAEMTAHASVPRRRTAGPRPEPIQGVPSSVVEAFEFVGVRKDGGKTYIEASAEKLLIGGTPGVLCYFVDKSSRVKEEADVEKRAREQEIIDRLLTVVHSSIELDTVCSSAVDELVRLLGFDAGGIYGPEENAVDLALVYSRDLPEKVVLTLQKQNIQEGVTGYIAKTLEPLILKPAEYPSYLPYKSLFESENYQTVVYVPLVAFEALAGAVFLVSMRASLAAAYDLQFLSLIGRHLGTAVENARQFERVRASERRYRSAVETIADVVYQAAPTGALLMISPQVERLVGYRPIEFIRNPEAWRSLVHPDDRAEYSRRMSGQAEENVVLQYRVLPKGKASYRWVRDAVSYQKEESGALVSISGIISDITERVEQSSQLAVLEEWKRSVEQGMQESEATLRHVIDAMGDALIISDLEGTIREVNREFTNFTGHVRQEVIGMDFPYPWVVEDEMKTFLLWISELREKQYLHDFDMRWRRKDGRELAISLNTTLLRNSMGEPVAMLNIARDITERKRLSTELAAKNHQIEMLNRIISSANTTVEFGRMFDAIAGEIRNLLPCDHVNVALLSEDGATMLLHAAAGRVVHSTPLGSGVPVARSVSKLAIAAREAVVVGDLAGHPDLGPDNVMAREGFRSQVSIPIFLNEKILGTLNVSSTLRDAYTRNDVAVLQPIADQIGAMIDRSRLYSEIQSQVHRITIMYDVSRGFSAATDTGALFRHVYEEVAKSIPLDLFAYDRYDPSRNDLKRYFEAAGGTVRVAEPGACLREYLVGSDALMQQVILRKSAIMGDGLSGESIMAVPVMVKNELVGILSFVKRSPHAYTRDHLRLVESIATLTEVALDRVLLYEDTVSKSAEIANRNRELDDFAYVVSHDLKEPLVTIEGYSKILLSDYKHALGDEGRQYLSSMVQSTARMKGLIEDLLTLSRIGRSPEGVEELPVGEVINEAIADFEFVLREKDAVVNVQAELPVVRYNRTDLGMVFRNLISNGLKFNRKSDPRIDIAVREEEGAYVFSVSDNGIGIPEEHYRKIFGIFQRLHLREEFGGTGAGLTIVKKVVETYGGKIWLESVVGEGTTFHFTVPK